MQHNMLGSLAVDNRAHHVLYFKFFVYAVNGAGYVGRAYFSPKASYTFSFFYFKAKQIFLALFYKWGNGALSSFVQIGVTGILTCGD